MAGVGVGGFRCRCDISVLGRTKCRPRGREPCWPDREVKGEVRRAASVGAPPGILG